MSMRLLWFALTAACGGLMVLMAALILTERMHPLPALLLLGGYAGLGWLCATEYDQAP